MHICIFEDKKGPEKLYPLTYLRATFELKCGMTNLLDKIILHFRNKKINLWVRDCLMGTTREKFDYPVNDIETLKRDDLLLVSGRLLIDGEMEFREEEGIYCIEGKKEQENIVFIYVKKEKLKDLKNIEDILIKNPEPETLQNIYRLKRSSIELRKSIWPIREVVNKLQREPSNLISDDLQIYLRDIYEHIFRISDLLENYRDIIFGMLDMYLSSVSNRMNDIMKVLTIISTIFIPLSFLSGFYGMNFLNMPILTKRHNSYTRNHRIITRYFRI